MSHHEKSFAAFVAPLVCAVAGGVAGCEMNEAAAQYDKSRTGRQEMFEVDPTRITDFSGETRSRMVMAMLPALAAAAASLAYMGCREDHQDNE